MNSVLRDKSGDWDTERLLHLLVIAAVSSCKIGREKEKKIPSVKDLTDIFFFLSSQKGWKKKKSGNLVQPAAAAGSAAINFRLQ